MPGAPTKLRKGERLTHKQRTYAQAVAAGKSYTDAALLAGYSPTGFGLHSNANKLANYPHIKREIESLRLERNEIRQLTTEDWHKRYERTWQRVADGDVGHALHALEIGAKVLGLYDSQQPIHPQAQALIAALAEGLARSRNTEAPKLPEAQQPPIHGAYQVLDGKAAPIEPKGDT